MAHTPIRGQLPFFCVVFELDMHSLRCAGDGNGDDHHRNSSAEQSQVCVPTIVLEWYI